MLRSYRRKHAASVGADGCDRLMFVRRLISETLAKPREARGWRVFDGLGQAVVFRDGCEAISVYRAEQVNGRHVAFGSN